MKHPAIISSSIIALAIFIYGLMQMWIANGQRYELHAMKFSDGGVSQYCTRWILDKRTGLVYLITANNAKAIIHDPVHSRITRRLWTSINDE